MAVLGTVQFPKQFLGVQEVKDCTTFADCPLLSRKLILIVNKKGLQ